MIQQSFKPVLIQITEDNYELSREGFNKCNIILGQQEYINGIAKDSVWFGGRNGTPDCVAYIGHNAEIVGISNKEELV